MFLYLFYSEFFKFTNKLCCFFLFIYYHSELASQNISVSTIVADFSKKRAEAIVPEMTETEINIHKLKNKNKEMFYSNIRNKKKIKNKYIEKDWSVVSRNRQNAVEKEILKAVQWEIESTGDENKFYFNTDSNSQDSFCLKDKGRKSKNNLECDEVKRQPSSTYEKDVKYIETKKLYQGSMGARAILHSLLSNYPLQIYE